MFLILVDVWKFSLLIYKRPACFAATPQFYHTLKILSEKYQTEMFSGRSKNSRELLLFHAINNSLIITLESSSNVSPASNKHHSTNGFSKQLIIYFYTKKRTLTSLLV